MRRRWTWPVFQEEEKLERRPCRGEEGVLVRTVEKATWLQGDQARNDEAEPDPHEGLLGATEELSLDLR